MIAGALLQPVPHRRSNTVQTAASSACVPASAVDSLFLHNETGIQYRVVRGAGAKLVLTPEDGKLEHGMLEGGSLEHWLIIGENRPRFDEQDAKKGENPVRFGETV